MARKVWVPACFRLLAHACLRACLHPCACVITFACVGAQGRDGRQRLARAARCRSHPIGGAVRHRSGLHAATLDERGMLTYAVKR